MVAAAVEDAQDFHAVVLDGVEKLVREAVSQKPPETPVIDGVALGMLFEFHERLPDPLQEFASQPRPLLVIPIARFRHVRLGPRMGANLPFHGLALRSRLSIASRHGRPAFGLRWYSSRA